MSISIIFPLLVTASVAWFPWWVSIVLFLIGIMLLRFAIGLVVPAMVADYLYAPGTHGFFATHLTIVLVALLLVIRYSILAKTRFALLYDFPKNKKNSSFS